MADHEVNAAQLHQELGSSDAKKRDVMGGPLTSEVKDLPEATEHGFLDEKAVSTDSSDPEQSDTPDGQVPSAWEKKHLRRMGESLPMSAFLVAIIELCERFTYYGCSGLFQNYVQRPLDGSQGRGALGMGHQGATGLTTFFQFWCYVTPIGGAIVADQYLGKYRTIVLFSVVYMIGLLILWTTALPAALDNGAGLGGFVTAIVVIGIGTGGIKSNVAPLIADQYKRRQMAISTLPSGERIILDPAITIQRIYMIFYVCINVGSLSLLATPYMEDRIGFWSAYLLCFCMFMVGFTVLVLGRKKYVVRPPQGSVITDAFKAIWLMIRYRNQDAPKQSFLTERGIVKTVSWDDHFIDELKRALVGCKVFCIYPLYWVIYGNFSGNFVTQAGQMQGHGIPNDLMQNFDPIAIIVFTPILDRLVYPALRKAKINFPPINRIVFGFWWASLAMAYAAIVQHLIYSAGPCYDQPLCDASMVDGVATGNRINIGIQAPAYAFIGISEIFASVTGLEYAYTKAPPSMKSFVQSMYLLTNAFGSAIGEALVPVTYDPAILWMFVSLSVASFLAGCLIWILFHHLNKTEEEMNAMDQDVNYGPETQRRNSKAVA